MSEFTFTHEKLQEMHKQHVRNREDMRKAMREHNIKDCVMMFMRYILSVNRHGQKHYAWYVYNYDDQFASDVADGLRTTFPDSTIVMSHSTMVGRIVQTLFHRVWISVTWN